MVKQIIIDPRDLEIHSRFLHQSGLSTICTPTKSITQKLSYSTIN